MCHNATMVRNYPALTSFSPVGRIEASFRLFFLISAPNRFSQAPTPSLTPLHAAFVQATFPPLDTSAANRSGIPGTDSLMQSVACHLGQQGK